MRLHGRRALVTGASRGIGRAIAVALAREGADVVVNYRSRRDAAEEAARQIEALGCRAVVVAADTSSRADVARLLDEAERCLGAPDLVVNNAGVLERTAFLEIAEDQWDRVLDTNLKGYFLVGQAAARRMIERGIEGAIVNVSSAGQALAAPNLTHYCVAKAGVAMLTKQMALELAPHGIRVNAVCPGLIETDLNRRDIADPAFRERRLARIPLKQIGVPGDVAAAVVFLASNAEARLVTGASIFIDGGLTISGA